MLKDRAYLVFGEFMKKTKSLKFNLSLLFSGLIVFVLCSVGIYNYFQIIDLKNKIAKDLVDMASSKVISDTLNLFEPIEQSTNIASNILNYNNIENNRAIWIEYFWNMNNQHSNVTSMYIADLQGNFFQSRNHPKKATREIYQNSKEEFWRYRDSDFNIVEIVEKKAKYNPTVRPWFIESSKTDEAIWSDLYMFESTKSLGLTISKKVYDRNGSFMGVVASDITLSDLSEFVKSLEVGKNSDIFIFDSKDKLIAYKDLSVYKNKVPSVYDLDSEVISKSIDFYKSNSEIKDTKLDLDSGSFITYFMEFPKEFKKDWTIAIIVDEDELLKDIYSLIIKDIVISIVILIIGLVMINMLSQRISNPIQSLSSSMDDIKNLNLDIDLKVDSIITEIRTMQSSVFSMQNGLRSFQKYIPADLVKDLIKEGKVAEIGGEKRYITVMFTDIENFTTLAEDMNSSELMFHISEYLDELSIIIKEFDGTIDKYIGDCVMAFWNAPKDIENHEELGCRCALAIQKRLEELNKKWKVEGKPLLRTRIGINSANVVVGNVGSHYRINYTLIGDGVNLAARLEAINKVYKTDIIVSEFTEKRVDNMFNFEYIDDVKVKGKNNSVKIYELKGEKEKKA